jgi:hypothetical protein
MKRRLGKSIGSSLLQVRLVVRQNVEPLSQAREGIEAGKSSALCSLVSTGKKRIPQ